MKSVNSETVLICKLQLALTLLIHKNLILIALDDTDDRTLVRLASDELIYKNDFTNAVILTCKMSAYGIHIEFPRQI
jgi:hypothetical protein